MYQLKISFNTVQELKAFVDAYESKLPGSTEKVESTSSIIARYFLKPIPTTSEEESFAATTIPADMRCARYTDYDDNKINEMYPLYPVKRIAEELGRAVTSVRARIHWLHKNGRLQFRKRNPSLARLKGKVIRITRDD